MAKKTSKGGKRILSIIFHLVVLVLMVSLYDSARALLKNRGSEPELLNKTTEGKKAPTKKTQTKGKMEERGTSMEDLMAEKQRKAKEKAEKAAQEANEKKSD